MHPSDIAPLPSANRPQAWLGLAQLLSAPGPRRDLTLGFSLREDACLLVLTVLMRSPGDSGVTSRELVLRWVSLEGGYSPGEETRAVSPAAAKTIRTHRDPCEPPPAEPSQAKLVASPPRRPPAIANRTQTALRDSPVLPRQVGRCGGAVSSRARPLCPVQGRRGGGLGSCVTPPHPGRLGRFAAPASSRVRRLARYSEP